jgi:hypothetical protein
MPSLLPTKALPLALGMGLASLLSATALVPAQAEPTVNPGRSRAPVSIGEVSSSPGSTLGTTNSRSKAPVTLHAHEAELGIETGNERSRAPVATP